MRRTAGVLLAALLFALAYDAAACARTIVAIGGRNVDVTVANTEALWKKGLAGRARLAPDEGMLFVFDADLKPGFWMKGMRFAIDIVWLDSERRIVHIVREVGPGTYPRTYAPPVPSRYAIELPAGFVRKHKVRVGGVAQW